MSWRVIYVEESEYLSLYLDNIKVKKGDEDILLPISDIHTIILDNYKTTLSVHLINALTKNNVNVVVCGIDHLPESLIIPIAGSYYAPKMFLKQLSWDDNLKKRLHKKIIISKITNQKELLKSINPISPVIKTLDKYILEVVDGDITNREGLAAKVYFRALFGENFKRFDEDVLNAGLNYGYAILRSQISKTLIGKGLNTMLGIFHKGNTNYFNLSDDVIEPFRPIIDNWVVKNLMNEKIFKKEHKIELIKQTTKKIKYKNLNQTIFNTISIYVDDIIKFFDTGEEISHPHLIYNEL